MIDNIKKLSWPRVMAALISLLMGACRPAAETDWSGYAEADLIYVASAIGGHVISMDVSRGTKVKVGDRLYELDTESEQIGRRESSARLQQAEAQTKNISSGKRAPELAVIEQQIKQAAAAQSAAQARMERQENLATKGFVSPAALDDIRAERDRTAARVGELEAELVSARLQARPLEIAAARAAEKVVQEEVAQATWREGQKQAIATVPATVFDVLYRSGELVAPNVPIIALLPDNALKIRFYIPQSALHGLAVGTKVAVSCNGCPSQMTAVVKFVSPQAEFTPPVIYSNESANKIVFLIEAQPEGVAAGQLKPGQPVSVRPIAKPVSAGAT